MPLSIATVGKPLIIRSVGGSPQVKQHLNELGFVENSEIMIVSELQGNLIVKIKDSRIALDKAMALKISVNN